VLSAVAMLVTRTAGAVDDPPNWGVQLGGPGVFEVVYRPRVFGPVLLELGAFAYAGGGMLVNASVGALLELAEGQRLTPYVAAGVGAAALCGESEAGLGCAGLVFVQARVGLGVDVGPEPANLLTFDVGGWLGGISSDERGLRPFGIPMLGVGYYW